MVNDIQGFGIRTWVPFVHSLAFAAVAPFVGHVSDLVGRRYLALVGTIIIIVGMVVVGTAHYSSVVIIGMAIAGMGGGITGVTGVAGVLEIVPVNNRGRYLGTVFMIFLPMGPSVAYGTSFFALLEILTDSSNVLGYANMALQRLDPAYRRWSCLGVDIHPISTSSSTGDSRLQFERACLSHRLSRWIPLPLWHRSFCLRPDLGWIQFVHTSPMSPADAIAPGNPPRLFPQLRSVVYFSLCSASGNVFLPFRCFLDIFSPTRYFPHSGHL